MGYLSRLLGIVDADPPKMTPAAQPHQFQFPMGPGGVTEDPAPWARAPVTLPDGLENKLRGEPLAAVQYRGPMDMAPSSPSYNVGGPVRGMEPASAPQAPMPQLPPTPDPAMAAFLSRALSGSQDSMDWYRRTGEQELAGLRGMRDRWADRTGQIERQRRSRSTNGTGGGGY